METHHVFKSHADVMHQLASYFVHRKRFKRASIDYTNGTIEAEQKTFPFRKKKFFLSVNQTSATVTKIEVTVNTRKNFRMVPGHREEKNLCDKFYFLL
jgi:hypothetical protein